MNEDKATRYHRQRRRAGMLSLVLAGGLLLCLALTGAGPALRDLAAGLAAGFGASGLVHFHATVALFVILLGGLLEAVTLPLTFYRGHVLERRYGLSEVPARSWLRGHLKTGFAGLGFLLLAAAAVYQALRVWPGRWWMAVAGGLVILSILLARLAPVLLVPRVHRLRPLARDELNARLVALARRAGARVIGVYEWRLGDDSRKTNAALVGLGHTRRILLSDTLLAGYSDDEIEAVLAHELAHHVHGDIWEALGLEALLMAAASAAAHGALVTFGPALGLQGPADVAGLPVLALAAGIVAVAFVPLANLLSRRHERRADRAAFELTGNASAFVSAMRRMAAQNLAEAEPPSGLVEACFYTHPPLSERVAAAREWADGGQSRTTSSPCISRQPSSIERLQ